jgi:hypothetical protein
VVLQHNQDATQGLVLNDQPERHFSIEYHQNAIDLPAQMRKIRLVWIRRIS